MRRLFWEEMASPSPDPHVLRFCLRKFRRFRDADILDGVLGGLRELVEASPQVVAYLTKIAGDQTVHADQIRAALAEFVVDPEATVFDWQRMWFLQALARIGNLGNGTISAVRRLLMEDRHRFHEAVVAHTLLLVGQHGDEADRLWIQGLYDQEHSPWIRRAILFAIRGMDKARRNHFYGYCKGQDHLTDAIIAYAVSETGP